MTKELSMEELFEEIKEELNFLPDDNNVKEGFLNGLTFIMML
ncbi:hypothetical protein [Geosporobacter ferrireducens]|nr:hypothetical protein [Geosporobacter ferrireducens]